MKLKTTDGMVIAVVCISVTGVLIYPRGVTVAWGMTLAMMSLIYLMLRKEMSKRMKHFEHIAEEHKLLHESIETNPTAFAVYDPQDRLIAWNEAYESLHRQAFELLQTKTQQDDIYYSDLIRVIAEQTLPAGEIEDYVATRVHQQRQADGSAIDREYPDYGWTRVSKFITPSGAVAGFAIDINELKQKEAKLIEEIERRTQLEVSLRDMANTDSMTQVANRRALFARAEIDFQQARRYENDFCVLMMDIDRFKSVNDRFGHQAGDEVIIKVAEITAGALRENIDLAGRLGGEEFSVLLPQTTLDGAVSCAERIRAAIESYPFTFGSQRHQVTVSLGITRQENSDTSFAETLNRADRALYQAKHLGRNRAVTLTGATQPARRPDDHPNPIDSSSTP